MSSASTEKRQITHSNITSALLHRPPPPPNQYPKTSRLSLPGMYSVSSSMNTPHVFRHAFLGLSPSFAQSSRVHPSATSSNVNGALPLSPARPGPPPPLFQCRPRWLHIHPSPSSSRGGKMEVVSPASVPRFSRVTSARYIDAVILTPRRGRWSHSLVPCMVPSPTSTPPFDP